jgi:hypothetical protein
MEEKLRFVFEYERHERPMTELCQRYEIAREARFSVGGHRDAWRGLSRSAAVEW